MLSQVPLRTVLEQFQEELAIEYVVPIKELDKLVSANFSDELVSKSLSKILASWDYALKVDQKGRVQQIFVVATIGQVAIKKIKKNVLKIHEFSMATFPKKMIERKPLPKTQVLLPGTKLTENSEGVAKVSPMFIGSSKKLRPMVIHQPQGVAMHIKPASNFMPVIPASGYPPLEILPVSEDAQMKFMEGYH